MASDIASSLEKLSLASENLEQDIDEFLDEANPRKRARISSEAVKANLEKDFLTPATTFSPSWLDRLQQRWETSTNYSELFNLAPTQTRTVIRFTREGLEGRVVGYREVTVPANSATAKNSTSILRKPANRADFVRGAAGFFPFAPGGLDAVQATAAYEDELLEQNGVNASGKANKLNRVIDFAAEGGLLEVPPGFSRGLRLPEKAARDVEAAEEVEQVLEEDPAQTGITNGVPVDGTDTVTPEEDEFAGEEEVDSLLPIEFPALAPHGPLAVARNKHGGREWAHMVDVDRDITNFHELVPEMARTWPFELDTFQKEAVYHLENGDSVFVAAHTSAGKTVVAEYAIALAAKHMTKTIYTSPIKALSNQKFRDFRQTFDDVGILTGDVQIRPEASCLIMTTEILRSMLYRGADLIRDVEFVVFDEVHYVNDLERGVVWEEVIIMLPEHVTLICLSATVPNTYEFASWVGRTKKKDIYVISTPKRPVPLEHYMWADKKMFKIVDSNKHFIEKGWKDANDAMSGRDKVIAAEQKAKEKEDAAAAAGRGGRGGGRGQSGRGGQQRGGGNQRGGPQQRGRGQPSARGQGNIARTGRGGGRTTAAQDRNIWVHLVQHLRKEELLPCCIFVFSKKRCEENADALSNLDFCTATEKSAIHMILEKSLARLKPDDKTLPQIRRIRELLSRGIAVHHGGLLPIVKECVEILFAKTLVKVLFATETFAMGLNLPTRTVVFSGFRKYDNKAFRDLLPGEYTQMSGRAGRRGLDSVGTVLLVTPGAEEAPPAARLRQMMLGDPTKLRSQFRLTYNMILNLLRVEALKIEEMIKRSFSENATQALQPEHEKQIKLSEADLAKVKRESCKNCDPDIERCHQASVDFQRLTDDLHSAMISFPVGRRMFQAKRLIVFRGKNDARTAGVLLRDGVSKTGSTVQVLEVLYKNPRKRQDADFLPYLQRFRRRFIPLPQNESEMRLRTLMIPLSDLEALTKSHMQIDIEGILRKDQTAEAQAKTELLATCSSWTSSTWDELDWRKYLKEMSLRTLLDERTAVANIAQSCDCIHCPDFPKHFAMEHDQWLIKDKIDSIRQLMSDQNLQLLPDYQQRIAVLKDLGFIDDYSRVELKGKVACEIHSADELVLTELVLENVLADYEPEEIVALLSSFVFQEKTDSTPNITPALERGIETIIKISEKVNQYQTLHQVILSSDDSNDFVSRPRFGLVEVVYEWARGMPFSRITDLTDVLEGTIVRVISRLDETCREVKNAARIIGDPGLFAKMAVCQEMIKRDICATASLYM